VIESDGLIGIRRLGRSSSSTALSLATGPPSQPDVSGCGGIAPISAAVSSESSRTVSSDPVSTWTTLSPLLLRIASESLPHCGSRLM
jgi:hypothetical protein